MTASVVPSAASSRPRRYDRTLHTMSCSRGCSITFNPKSSLGPTSHWRMINLEGLDLLDEIGRVSADVDYIANAQRGTRFELHGHD
jgi:hypothetical protein